MSRQKVKNKIYALIVVVTLFVSVNNLSQAEEKSKIIGTNGTNELADNQSTSSEEESEAADTASEKNEASSVNSANSLTFDDEIESVQVKGKKIKIKKVKTKNNAKNKNKNKEKDLPQIPEQKIDYKVGSINLSQSSGEVPSELLTSQIPVRTGDDYSNKSLSDIYLSLRRLGYVADVNVFPQAEGNNVNIAVEVSEAQNAGEILKRQQLQEELKRETNYTVTSVDIQGTKLLNKEDYLKDLPIKSGDIFIPQKAIDGAQKIFKSGYFSAVEPKIDRKADNTVSVLYEVRENPIIQGMNFEGNTLFSNEEIGKALKVKVGEILNSNLLDPDDNGILDLYNKNGYTLVRIESINVSEDGILNLGLTEGVVDSVEYSKAPSKRDNERQSLKHTTLRTKPYVFERYQKIIPGDIFEEKNVTATLKELYRTGIFTSIVPKIGGKEEDPNARIVEFVVEERPTTTINGSISYGTSVGLVGEVKLSDSNFLGRAQDAAITLSASNKGDKTFELSWFDPWIRGTERVQAGGSAYWTESVDDNAEKDEVEKVKRIGTRWTIGKGLNSDIFVRLSARYEHFKELFGNKTVNDKYNLVALTPMLVYNTRDNDYSPTKGIYATLSYERGELIKDPRQYDQFEADLRAYHPTFFGEKNVMAYRVAWGKTGSGTPEALKFSIGGAESLRGYDSGAFDGYDKFHATIENRTKINDTIQLVAFFDIGNAWQREGRDPVTGKRVYKPNRKEAHDFKELKKGYGVGVRLNTPIGPLRFDYGWPMDPEKKGEKKDKGKFYFSFGQSF